MQAKAPTERDTLWIWDNFEQVLAEWIMDYSRE